MNHRLGGEAASPSRQPISFISSMKAGDQIREPGRKLCNILVQMPQRVSLHLPPKAKSIVASKAQPLDVQTRNARGSFESEQAVPESLDRFNRRHEIAFPFRPCPGLVH